MKKVVVVLLLVVLVASMAGCGAPAASSVSSEAAQNTFATYKNDVAKWFDLSSRDLIKIINERAMADGYEEIKNMNGSVSRFGSEKTGAFLEIEVGMGVPDKDPQAGKIKSIELNMFAKDAEQAAINGYYADLLIEIFNPNSVDEIEKNLYMFDEKPSDMPSIIRVIKEGVVYNYIVPERAGDKRIELIIYPDEDTAEEIVEKIENMPIKPTK